MNVMLTSHASSKAEASVAAITCSRVDILMKRTWPCERMKNSRSGNHVRRRCSSALPAIFCNSTPTLSMFSPSRARLTVGLVVGESTHGDSR